MNKLLLILYFWVASFLSNAQTQTLSTEYYVDSTRVCSISEVVQKAFTPVGTKKMLNFRSTNDPIWVKVEIPPSVQNQFLEIPTPIVDTIDLYTFVDSSFVKKRYGSHVPFKQRPNSDYGRFFYFDVKPNETIYFRINSTFQIQLPLKLIDRNEVARKNNAANFFYGGFFGILIALFGYNLFLALSIRNKIYIHYLGYLFTAILFYATLTGYGFMIAYPDAPRLNYYVNIPANMGLVFILEFSSLLLKIKENSIQNYWFIKFLTVITLIVTGLELVLGNKVLIITSMLTQILSLGVCLYLITLGIYILRVKNQRQAIVYIMAWSTYLFGIILFVLNINGVVPNNFLTTYSMHIGSGCEAILFSIALALNLNKFRKQQEIALQNQQNQLLINQKLANEKEIDLQKKVEERTHSLKKEIEEMEHTNRMLKLKILNSMDSKSTTLNNEKIANIESLKNNLLNLKK